VRETLSRVRVGLEEDGRDEKRQLWLVGTEMVSMKECWREMEGGVEEKRRREVSVRVMLVRVR
jgi:hypothetical protein